MIPGFNSNVRYAGVEYHVQTEDLGRKNPCVLTLVYQGGSILAREKVNYRDALGEGATGEEIKSFMEQQHQRVMARVMSGQIRGPASPAPQPPAPSPRGPSPSPSGKNLDQLIAEYVRSRTPKPG
jgi:hypothetical protein